jgi:tetratricopeptide (TPR) repeat protein
MADSESPSAMNPLEFELQSAQIHQRMAATAEGMLASEHQEKSIEAFREALAGLETDGTPEQRAFARHQLGISLRDRAGSAPLEERDALLAEAEQCFRDALEVFTRDNFPLPHGMASDNLAIVLHARSEWPVNLDAARKAAWLQDSMANNRTALEVFESLGRKRDAQRIRLNMLMSSDGKNSAEPSARPRERLEHSIRELEAILADPALAKPSFTRSYAQRRLAALLIELANSDPAQAALHLDRAEKILIDIPGMRLGDSRAWASVQNLLGRVHMARSLVPEADKSRHLEKALEHLNEALEVFTPQTAPLDWAHNRLLWGYSTAILSDSPSVPENQRDAVLREGLIATLEAMNAMTTDPVRRAEGITLIEVLKNPATADEATPSVPPSAESPIPPQK